MLRSLVEIAYRRERGPVRKPASPATLADRARWFALVAAIVWLYTAWAPWVVRCPISAEFPCSLFVTGAADAYSRALLDPVELRPFVPCALGWVLDPVVWGALTPLGVLIALCLWSRRLVAVARVAFALWLLVMVGMATLTLSAWATFPPADPNVRMRTGVGIFAVFIVVSLLVCAAICLAMRSVRLARQPVTVSAGAGGTVPPAQVRTRPPNDGSSRLLQIGGAVTLSLGIICWVASWLFLLWTPTVQDPNDCFGTPHDCLGLSASRVMEMNGYRFIPLFDPSIFHYAFPVLLVGGAALALYVAWWPRLRPRHWLGIAFWLVVATWAYSLAIGGADTIDYLGNGIGFNPVTFPPEVLAGFGIGVGFASVVPFFAVLFSARPAQRRAS